MDRINTHFRQMGTGVFIAFFLSVSPGPEARAAGGITVQTPTLEKSSPSPVTVKPVQKKPVTAPLKTAPAKGKFILLPEITHLEPLGCFIAGDTVKIAGKNFGAAQGSRKLIIKPSNGGSIQINGPSWKNDRITFTVPSGVPLDDTGKIGIYENKQLLDDKNFYLCTAEHTMPGSPPEAPGGLGIASSSPAAKSVGGASSLKSRMTRGTESKMLSASLKGGAKAAPSAKSVTPLKMTPARPPPDDTVPPPDDTSPPPDDQKGLRVRSAAVPTQGAPVMADPKAPRSAFGGKAMALRTGVAVPAPNPEMTRLGGNDELFLITRPRAEDSPACPGDVVPIRWAYGGAMSTTVNISLRQGPVEAKAIATGTQNRYEYDWTVPGGADGVREGTYTIRVESPDGEPAGESVPVEFSSCGPQTARLQSSMTAGQMAAGAPLQMAEGPAGELRANETDLSDKIGDLTAPGLYLKAFPAPTIDAYFTGFRLTSVVPRNKGITVDPTSSFPVADKIEVEIACPFGKKATSARIVAPHDSGWQARPHGQRMETYPFMNYGLYFPNSSMSLAEHCYQGDLQTREGESGHISQAQIGVFVEWICEGETDQVKKSDRAMVFNINLVCPAATTTRPAARTVVGYSHRCPPGYVLIGTNSSSIVDPLASDPRLCVKE